MTADHGLVVLRGVVADVGVRERVTVRGGTGGDVAAVVRYARPVRPAGIRRGRLSLQSVAVRDRACGEESATSPGQGSPGGTPPLAAINVPLLLEPRLIGAALRAISTPESLKEVQ